MRGPKRGGRKMGPRHSLKQKESQRVQPTGAPFRKDERVLCLHLDLLYEAKVLDVQVDKDGFLYMVHYKGWKSTWDDWVGADRIKKYTPDNIALAETLLEQRKKSGEKRKIGNRKSAVRTPTAGDDSEMGSGRGASEEHGSATITLSGRAGPRRVRDYELEQEEEFHNRPSIDIPLPTIVEAMLVDDWENVTSKMQLVPIPHAHPVTEIIKNYLDHERARLPADSAEYSLTEEILLGLSSYFDLAIGRVLMYKFERVQYSEIYQMWKEGTDPKYTRASDTYGAEHLARLLSNLPEFIAQTNMDQESVSTLREQMVRFADWLGRNFRTYFASEYETPPNSYIAEARQPR